MNIKLSISLFVLFSCVKTARGIVRLSLESANPVAGLPVSVFWFRDAGDPADFKITTRKLPEPISLFDSVPIVISGSSVTRGSITMQFPEKGEYDLIAFRTNNTGGLEVLFTGDSFNVGDASETSSSVASGPSADPRTSDSESEDRGGKTVLIVAVTVSLGLVILLVAGALILRDLLRRKRRSSDGDVTPSAEKTARPWLLFPKHFPFRGSSSTSERVSVSTSREMPATTSGLPLRQERLSSVEPRVAPPSVIPSMSQIASPTTRQILLRYRISVLRGQLEELERSQPVSDGQNSSDRAGIERLQNEIKKLTEQEALSRVESSAVNTSL